MQNLEEDLGAGEARHHLEAAREVRPGQDEGVAAFQDLQPLIYALRCRAPRVLGGNPDTGAFASQAAAGLDAAALARQRVVEAHRDLQPAQRLVHRGKRPLDLGGVRRARAQEELPTTTRERAVRLKERLKRRQHLLDRLMSQLNDFKRLLREPDARKQRRHGCCHQPD